MAAAYRCTAVKTRATKESPASEKLQDNQVTEMETQHSEAKMKHHNSMHLRNPIPRTPSASSDKKEVFWSKEARDAEMKKDAEAA